MGGYCGGYCCYSNMPTIKPVEYTSLKFSVTGGQTFTERVTQYEGVKIYQTFLNGAKGVYEYVAANGKRVAVNLSTVQHMSLQDV